MNYKPDRTVYSELYARYALLLLMIINTFSLLDRQIIGVLAEPIKRDLNLSDSQLGMLSGLAFAGLYTTLGVPLARLADRGDRSRIIVASLSVWSFFTMLCGFTVNYWTLLLARMGVGVGEAGGTPAAHSLITASTPLEHRAGALAFYNLSLPLAALLGMGFGGLMADAWGWRGALIVAGAPGLLLAVLAFFTLREPRRGAREGQAESLAMSTREVSAEFRGTPAFWWLALGAALGGVVFYGQNAFLASLLLRTHGQQVAELAQTLGLRPHAFTGIALGIVIGVFLGIGTWLGGRLGNRWGGVHVSGYAKVPSVVLPIATPLFVAVGLAPNVPGVLIALALAVMCQGLILGPVTAAVQSVVRPGARATASALQLLVTSLLGLGLGPLLVGILSDVLSARYGPILGLRWAVAAAGIAYAFAWLSFFLAYRIIRRSPNVDEAGTAGRQP